MSHHEHELAVEDGYPKRKRNNRSTAKDKETHTGASGNNEEDSGPPKKKTTQPKWEEMSLNSDCSEKHRLKDCRNTSAEKKKELLKDFYANKRKAKTTGKSSAKEDETSKEVKAVSCPATIAPNADRGRYSIKLEGEVEAIMLGDYGADVSVMPISRFEKVWAAVPAVEEKISKEKRKLVCAFKSNGEKDRNLEFSASRSTKLSITIILPDSQIPLGLHGVEFYIVDQHMDEMLLSRPFLNKIEFDLTDHLHRVREHINDKDVREIDTDAL